MVSNVRLHAHCPARSSRLSSNTMFDWEQCLPNNVPTEQCACPMLTFSKVSPAALKLLWSHLVALGAFVLPFWSMLQPVVAHNAWHCWRKTEASLNVYTNYLWLPDKVWHVTFGCMTTHTTRPCIGVNHITCWCAKHRDRCVVQQLIAHTCMLVQSISHNLSTRKVLGNFALHNGDRQLVLTTTTLSSYAACLKAYSNLEQNVDNSHTNVHLIPLILPCISKARSHIEWPQLSHSMIPPCQILRWILVPQLSHEVYLLK